MAGFVTPTIFTSNPLAKKHGGVVTRFVDAIFLIMILVLVGGMVLDLFLYDFLPHDWFSYRNPFCRVTCYHD